MRIRGIKYPIEETLKNKIIHRYDEYHTYSYNYAIPSFQGETTFFELFTKQQNTTEQNGCKMLDCEINVPDNNVNYEGYVITGNDAITNYVKNTGGIVNQISNGIAKISIPNNAFRLYDLEFALKMFFHEFEEISSRYDLINKEGKNMPKFREEHKYTFNLDDSIWIERFASIVVIVFSLLLMLF